MAHRRIPEVTPADRQRLFARIELPEDRNDPSACWGYRDGRDYKRVIAPRIWIGGKALLVRRVMFALQKHDPQEQHVNVSCGNQACVRPLHMFVSQKRQTARADKSKELKTWLAAGYANGINTQYLDYVAGSEGAASRAAKESKIPLRGYAANKRKIHGYDEFGLIVDWCAGHPSGYLQKKYNVPAHTVTNVVRRHGIQRNKNIAQSRSVDPRGAVRASDRVGVPNGPNGAVAPRRNSVAKKHNM